MDDFAVFILTHGRPDRLYTYNVIKARGYTGRIVIVVDDLDPTVDKYKATYGSEVYVFNKREEAQRVDVADNFDGTQTVLHARNTCFRIARELGIRYFLQLDDDYTYFEYRFDDEFRYCSSRGVRNLDAYFGAMLEFFKASGALTIAAAQGGDFIGGRHNMNGESIHLTRKAMNSFFCDATRPIQFVGRMNDDVNTYVLRSSRGDLFLTANQVSLTQLTTQQNDAGLTDMYLSFGTYIKSFYTVMMHPSSVTVSAMGAKHMRLHHRVDWKKTTPMIVSESIRKTSR